MLVDELIRIRLRGMGYQGEALEKAVRRGERAVQDRALQEPDVGHAIFEVVGLVVDGAVANGGRRRERTAA